jgi:hypothetical protein
MNTGVIGALNDFRPLAGAGSQVCDVLEESRYMLGGPIIQSGRLLGGVLGTVSGQVAIAGPTTIDLSLGDIGSVSVNCNIDRIPLLPRQFPRPARSTSFRALEEAFALDSTKLWADTRAPRGLDIEAADTSKRILSSSSLLPCTPNLPKVMVTFISEKRSSSSRPPYASLVHSLVEKDQIVAARALLGAVPNEAMGEPQLQVLRRVLAPPKVTTRKIMDSDRTREYKWLQEHGHDYRGKWVAVDGSFLIAVAESLKELLTKLKDLQVIRRPLIHHMAE